MTDDSEAAGGDTPADGETTDDNAAGSETPAEDAGDDTPADGEEGDEKTIRAADADRFVGYGVVYAGVLFLLVGVRADPRTLDLPTAYFLGTGAVFVGGGLYRLANPVEGGSIPESKAEQVVVGLALVLMLLTGAFLLSLL
jgi:hypothetical protein